MFLMLLFLSSCTSNEKEKQSAEVLAQIWDAYDTYREPLISNRFFKHADLQPLLERHAQSDQFYVELLGHSVQGRSISMISIGEGEIPVLLWSQMHGDESTATMALFDLFNFFQADDAFTVFKQNMLKKIRLHFIPMLNPDWAEIWRRRNAQDIDINRDARALSTPEGQLLKAARERIYPKFGFNLHDQGTHYTTAFAPEPASISFLAPAYNHANEINAVRADAQKLIVRMNRTLQVYAPAKVGRYDDAHEPRSFGDNFQGWGTSTILIESGGYPDDQEKQYLRKLNFIILLAAFEAIAAESYRKEKLEDYRAIPENSRLLYDLVIRNLEIEREGIRFSTNLGINRQQIRAEDFRSMASRGQIEEVGDMVHHFGYQDIDASALHHVAGKVISMKQEAWQALSPQEEWASIKQGYLFVIIDSGEIKPGPVMHRLQVILNKEELLKLQETAALGSAANFYLADEAGQLKAVIINGYFHYLDDELPDQSNTWAY